MPSNKMQKRIEATQKRCSETKARAVRAFDNARHAKPGEGMTYYETCEDSLQSLAVAMEQLGRETNTPWERPKELFTLIGVDPAQAKAIMETQCLASLQNAMARMILRSSPEKVAFSRSAIREEYSRFVGYARRLGLDVKSDEQLQKAGIDTVRLATIRTHGALSPEGYHL